VTRGALSVAVAAILTGCGARTSPGDGAIRRADAAAVADDAAASPCLACLGAACVNAYVHCEQSSDCAAIEACVAVDANVDGCICAAVAGASAYLALEECIQTELCSNGVCTTTCGANAAVRLCGTPLVAPVCSGLGLDAGRRGTPQACDACVSSSCATLATACAPGSDCQALLTCRATCATAACDRACEADHAAGLGAAEALDVCLGASCGSECAF